MEEKEIEETNAEKTLKKIEAILDKHEGKDEIKRSYLKDGLVQWITGSLSLEQIILLKAALKATAEVDIEGVEEKLADIIIAGLARYINIRNLE